MREYFEDATQDTFVELVETVVAPIIEGESFASIEADLSTVDRYPYVVGPWTEFD
jgi:hypothetical protein